MQCRSTTLNAPLGIVIFTLGGLAGAVFYLPFKKVKGWAWESYWMVYAVFGLILVPWFLTFTTSPKRSDRFSGLRRPTSLLIVSCAAPPGASED